MKRLAKKGETPAVLDHIGTQQFSAIQTVRPGTGGTQHNERQHNHDHANDHEARDSIRYGYATGWAHLHAVADRISVLA